MDEYLAAVLSMFTAKQSDDEVKRDLELTCQCGDVVCDIEPGDSMEVLVNVAVDHASTCAEFLPPEGT